MLEGAQGRDRLVLSEGGFVTRRGREAFSLEALQQLAAAEPERLSPNVLLRPIVESALLPTVAYLGGPGELKYLALTLPIYERMRVPRQTVLPRWSGAWSAGRDPPRAPPSAGRSRPDRARSGVPRR